MSFPSELVVYVRRARAFDARDWLAYAAWVGLIASLAVVSLAFLLAGRASGVRFPAEAWMVPAGAAVFATSIAVDTIGHRTVYRHDLRRGEGLVHEVTIACGAGSCVILCAAYTYRDLLWVPALVLTVLSLVYSMIDEAFHWQRYVRGRADRVEMWSHLGILTGHGTMMLGWWSWFWGGYGGVAETVASLAR